MQIYDGWPGEEARYTGAFTMTDKLTIALTKGRILKETLPLLASAGIEPLEDLHTSRKLIFATTVANIQLVIIRGTDVPTYVRHGAADMGVVGRIFFLSTVPTDCMSLWTWASRAAD